MKDKANLRLGFHYHIPMEYREDGIYTPAYFGVFIDSLAPHFAGITCFMYAKGSMKIDLDYKLVSPNVNLVELGPYASIPRRMLRFIFQKSKVRQLVEDLDVFLVRASTPLLKDIYQIAGKKTVLMLVSNAVDGLDQLNQPAWRLTLIKWWARRYQAFEDKVSKHQLTLVNSDKLLADHTGLSRKLFRIRTTTLSKGDIYLREDTMQNETIRILFTGRVAPNKGIQDILSAFISLRNKTPRKIQLCIVGPYSGEDSFFKSLKTIIRENNLESEVEFVGYVTAGPKLLKYYREADVFVMASRSSAEGFPRVLWEAMASSLPVLASRVSGIDRVLDGKAGFFDPGSSEQLLEQLELLISDPEVRRSRIREAREFAKTNTLEESGAELAKFIVSEYSA